MEETQVVEQEQVAQPDVVETSEMPIETTEESAPSATEDETTSATEEKSNVQKRIDALTKEKYDAIRDQERKAEEVEYWKQQAQQKQAEPKVQQTANRPDADDFDTDAEYFEAIADWKAEQKFQEVEQRRTLQQQQETSAATEMNFREKLEQAKTEIPDFESVAWLPGPHPVTGEDTHSQFRQLVMECDAGDRIAYELGKMPVNERTKILNQPQHKQALWIGRMDAKLSNQTVKTKKVSEAPKPITPVSGTDIPMKSLEKMSISEYAAYRRKNPV